jgi:superfamily I DNA and RNA helicase
MKGLAALGATIALAIPAAGAFAAAPDTPIAHAACTRAKIEGQSKCIARGQFCRHTARAERDYERYGLRCNKRDARGNWHLT